MRWNAMGLMMEMVPAIAPQIVTDDAPLVSAIINRQGFDALEFAIATGALATAGASFAILVQDGNDPALADAETVSYWLEPPGEVTSTGSFTGAQPNSAFKIGYQGSKQYVRLTITPASNSGAANIGAVAILGAPQVAPV
ncbi:MAG: hypothetical protein WAK96_06985 [Desulfobaccales bacterium]